MPLPFFIRLRLNDAAPFSIQTPIKEQDRRDSYARRSCFMKHKRKKINYVVVKIVVNRVLERFLSENKKKQKCQNQIISMGLALFVLVEAARLEPTVSSTRSGSE